MDKSKIKTVLHGKIRLARTLVSTFFQIESVIWDCELSVSLMYVTGQLSIREKLNNTECKNYSTWLRPVTALEDPTHFRK
jgi:hypothetical protein